VATIALAFTGPINHPATGKLRNAICSVPNERVQDSQGTLIRKYDTLYLLLDSTGGSLDDGFSLYGLIRTVSADLGVKVITVNMGLIASIANVVFLVTLPPAFNPG